MILSFDEAGALLGEIGISRDFTERRRVREQIAEREQRLLMALQGASLGIWDWDIGTGRMSFSPLWAEMLGRTLDEVAQDVSSWEALVHPEDWSHIQATLGPHLRGETKSYTAERSVCDTSADKYQSACNNVCTDNSANNACQY